MLTAQDGGVLVKLARAAIIAHLSRTAFPKLGAVAPSLKEPGGVFVTLLDHSNGNVLRGCIGIPLPTSPLLEQIRIAAVEAATADPRFRPIGLNEFERQIIVEATVLSPMEPIWVRNPLDLKENIIVGRDGLMVEGMGGHGLLLPQVAVDEGFDSEEFLSQCCMKAGLPPDAWLTGNLRVSRFRGQVFAEEKPNGHVIERCLAQK